MISSKEKFRTFITLSKREQRGLLVVVFMMALLIFIPEIYIKFIQSNESVGYSIEERIQLLEFIEISKKEVKPELENALFSFDPNSISKTQMQKLGFPDFLSDRLIKYRNSGGRFRSKEELLRIYGMKETFYIKLKPYISIEKEEFQKSSIRKEPETFEERNLILNLNSCDSSALIGLKGIGPVLSSRIIRYRNLLGGYISKEQLWEVYGLSDSTIDIISPHLIIDQQDSIEKIPINNIEIKQLRKHPYFRNYNLCTSIINYRNQHGDYRSFDEMKANVLVTDSTLEKISSYITFD